MEKRDKLGRFVRGRSVIPWNKGIPCSDNIKKSISKSEKGRLSDNKGKSYDEIYGEEKALIIKSKISNSSEKNGRKKGFKCSKETIEKMRENTMGRFIGEKSPLWKGGITPLNRLLRKSSMFKIWRELVFLRDNFTCQNPNCEFCHNQIGVFLHPHHKKSFAEYPELRFVISNGITYCAEFHINSKLLHKRIKQEVN